MKFNTIKSKITLILAGVTVVFFAVLSFFCYAYFSESETLILDSYGHTIAEIAQGLNDGIITVEHNASDLAVVGHTFYEHAISEDTLKRYLKSDLDHYKEPIGVGVWFLPYKYKSDKRLYSINAIRTHEGDVIINDYFSSEKYNYPEQSWFKQSLETLKPERVIWTLAHADAEDGLPLMITASAGIYSHDGKTLIGVATVDWDFDTCIDIMSRVKPTPGSFSLFADKKNNYIFFLTDDSVDSGEAVGTRLETIPWYENNLRERVPFSYLHKTYVPFINELDNGMMLIINVPQREMLDTMYYRVFLLLSILGLLSTAMISMLYLCLSHDVMKPINKLISLANKIGRGETDTHIKIEKPAEFALLASTYDKMTENIKQITMNQTKMNYELSVANSIQISSLPNVFPPFPEHKEFSIYASMEPAKEVGGDFYDFYFKDSNHLMFLVADVSGKGVPAALFMMTVKTLINNISPTIASPEELIETINKKLYSTNKEGFFVTMFAAIVNIKTGEMTCMNCGHNPPLLRRNNGKYEYLNIDPNMVLGIFDKIDLKLYNTTLNTGDAIFLYTDGITEAVNPENEIYGEARLEECINEIGVVPVEEVVKQVKEKVKEFTRGHSQSDDATMLMFQYNKTIRNFEKPALKENYKDFKEWLHTTCKEWELNEEVSNKLDMCGEEIFANICFYAYPNETGDLSVTLEKNDKLVTMVWEDSGVIYNPLQKPDPDLDIPPRERKLGGLGIFMVKQMANDIKYQRINNKNILTLVFEV